MSWTYKPNLDELEIDLQRDTSTEDRWTFHRLMYFEPSQYEDWSKGSSTTGTSYLMELKENSNIPSAGVNLTGSLSAFYVKDIYGIQTMTSEDHMDKFSYAVVDILYENKKESNDNYGGLNNEGLKPWELPVEDFLVTNVANEVPARVYDQASGNVSRDWPRNSAYDVIYGLTMPEYTQRITWSIATQNKDYSFKVPFINANEITFWDGVKYNGKYHTGGTYNGGKIIIEEGAGLFLPPSLKRAFYKNKSGKYEAYDIWSYEVIVNEKGHLLSYKDAGKRALKERIYTVSTSGEIKAALSTVYDICSWYTIKPNPQTPSAYIYQRGFGDFNKMMAAKKTVDDYNEKLSTNDTRQATFYGDFVQDSLPLQYGTLNYDAISGNANFNTIYKYVYLYGEVKLGVDSNSNIAFRPKVIED